MSISKIIILTLFSLSINTLSRSQEVFKPVKFEREATVSVDVPPDDLFSLLGPRGSRLINKSDVDFLYGSEEDMNRAMFRIKGHSGSWVWYAVGKYDIHERIYRASILMPDDEYWLNEYQVKPNGKGGSLFTMKWRITGFNDKTNSSIQAFLDYEKTTQGQDFKQRVQRTADALSGYLKNSGEPKQEHQAPAIAQKFLPKSHEKSSQFSLNSKRERVHEIIEALVEVNRTAPFEKSYFLNDNSPHPGSIYFSAEPNHGQKWRVISLNDKKDGMISYFEFYPDGELFYEEFKLTNQGKKTLVTHSFKVVGASADSQKGVDNFMTKENGYQQRVDNWKAALTKRLEDQ